ncbi:MAG: PhnD/SsuA/transferrin family substrate-binding protein [Deltaproteobacteria bacterium]|nr:PhnD/SsuA/transferrin family substrate-binding protein [Deltaproteobacteria bacterium]
MKRFFVVMLLCVSVRAFAGDLAFYIIYPDGEGDTESARPYLGQLYDYLNEKTGLSVDGLYLNDPDEAVLALKNKGINLAIVSPDFFEQYKDQFQFSPVLKTIPVYSAGPYEKYYIMAEKNVDIADIMEKNTPVSLFSSKAYDDAFLNNKVFYENAEIKKITWVLGQSPDIVNTIKEITAGKKNTFVLLTGYEFSVINDLKKKNMDFARLKLVYTSREQPSSPLILIGTERPKELPAIKEALLGMPLSLSGNLILKKLRLKGFAEIQDGK